MLAVLMFVGDDVPAMDLVLWKENKDSIILDRAYIRKIFTKRINKWPNGQPVVVFIKPNNSIEHKDFVQTILGISPYQYENALNNEIVYVVPNDAQMIMRIEQTPGSIGYLNYTTDVNNKKLFNIDARECLRQEEKSDKFAP